MNAKDEARLRDIAEAALLARQYIQGMTYQQFVADTRTQDAVIRRLEIMGEAAGRISEEARSAFPDVPFRQMRGMRNILSHDYGEIHLERVWTTLEQDLPRLIANLLPLFPTLSLTKTPPRQEP